VGLFDRYGQKNATPAQAEPEYVPTIVENGHTARTIERKGHPTPTRAKAEAARMAALHPHLTKKQLAAQDREAKQVAQQRALAAADERPERVLLRNYIDARWCLPEFSMPILLLVLVGLIVGGRFPMLALVDGFVLYAFIIVCVVNVIVFWRGFTKELYVRLPGTSTKGMVFLMIQRMMSMRRFRTPGAAIARGSEY
jgi:hypothetical protein